MALSPQRRYQNELKRYGLGLGGIQTPSKLTFDAPVKGGSVQRKLRGGIGSSGAMRTPFAEDGAGADGYDFDREQFPDDPLAGLTREEAIDYLVSMGIDVGNPTLGMSGIVKRAKNRPQSVLPNISSDVGGITEFAEAYAKLAETNRPEPSISERPDMVSLMESNPSAFADSPLDAIAAQIAKAQIDPSLSGANDSEIAQRMIEDRKRSAEEAAALGVDAVTDNKMNKDAIAGLGILDDSSEKNPEEAVQTAFVEAMNPYLEALNKKVPTANNREELLEKYKKEFSDATGIEINGKVDKSQALMAMGLSLMQNRAGKGFNVGKLLNAVGQAGDAAMPYLREATKEAKAAKVAAGKYALEKIASGESAAAAIASEEKAFQRERYLKLLQLDADIEKEKIKAGGKINELKNVKVDKVINGLDVQRGRGATGAVFVFPEDALRDTSGALKSVNGALTTVDTMLDLASQIASEESPTFSLISERVNTALVGAGLVDSEVVFGESKVGREQQIRILQDSIITQFKRMLTQETGNGISKSDVDNIRTMLGEIDLLGNPEQSILRLQEIKTLFTGKRTAVRGVLDELQNPDSYPTVEEYEKNMELYPSLIEGSMQYTVNKSGNSSVIDVKDN